ncbi:MAG: IucA/IucC family siderophore biosynthesis protein [Nannocystaceae bacterium]|nr:IucA/IucC family siderophore biosynthesis protein [Nannocystaceae bacterium]
MSAPAHLQPEVWRASSEALAAKIIAELAHERVIEPEPHGDDRFALQVREGCLYTFAADRYALDHWVLRPGTLVRTKWGQREVADGLELLVDLRAHLDLSHEDFPGYFEELVGTLNAAAFRRASVTPSAHELAQADLLEVEAAMTEGHPCFIANGGRLGFDANDVTQYTPEAATPFRIGWLAARREHCVFAFGEAVDAESFVAQELGPLHQYGVRTLQERGLDPADYVFLPVHPWQWRYKIATGFSSELAAQRLVWIGESEEHYVPQQSIRTLFNTSNPARPYVKFALSILNMGFVRGLSPEYMQATPAINDWLASRLARDPELHACGFELLREIAAVGYVHPHYAAVAAPSAPQRKMLSALWRESPIPKLNEGERAMTMAALLHRDRAGVPLVHALIEVAGIDTDAWLAAYLRAYLRPLLHCFFAHQLAFMPHGENVIVVLRNAVVQRVLVKDIAEEVLVFARPDAMPDSVSRVLIEVSDEVRRLHVLTDVFDSFFRFFGPILAERSDFSERAFWDAVERELADYERAHPELAEPMERLDLRVATFPRLCLNRLQFRSRKQMLDLANPTASFRYAGTLDNPLAGRAPQKAGGVA